MKKTIRILMILLLAVCLLPHALADDHIATDDEIIRSMCWQGDTLYLLGEGLSRWQPGNAAPQPIWRAEGIDSMRYWETPPEDESDLALWRQAIRYIFPGEDAPIALHPYTGELFSVGAGGLTLLATIPEEGRTYEQDGETMPRSVLGAAGQDGAVWLLLASDNWEEWNKRTILRYDMADGSVSAFDIDRVEGISAAGNGRLLLSS